VCTTDPGYYRWTQWIFLQLFRRGLAYQAEVPVNWCPALGTVLAHDAGAALPPRHAECTPRGLGDPLAAAASQGACLLARHGRVPSLWLRRACSETLQLLRHMVSVLGA